jgi:hypothetical protein
MRHKIRRRQMRSRRLGPSPIRSTTGQALSAQLALPVTVAMKLLLEARRGRAIAELIFGSLASSCLVSRATSSAVSLNPTLGLEAPSPFPLSHRCTARDPEFDVIVPVK